MSDAWGELQGAEDAGRIWRQGIFKTTNVSGQNIWSDLSVAGGVPSFNPYGGAPLEATPMFGQRNRSIYVGPDAPGKVRRLEKIWLSAPGLFAPATVLFCDYLLFYPLIDRTIADLQEMDNSEVLPRYASGDGVQIFPVITVAGATAITGTVTYTNSAGVEGRTASLSSSVVTAGGIGTTSSPFLTLAAGDRGVRSIQSVQCSGLGTGFLALVLCKPLATLPLLEARTAHEVELAAQGLKAPVVQDGAFLNLLSFTSAATATNVGLYGAAEFTWSDS